MPGDRKVRYDYSERDDDPDNRARNRVDTEDVRLWMRLAACLIKRVGNKVVIDEQEWVNLDVDAQIGVWQDPETRDLNFSLVGKSVTLEDIVKSAGFPVDRGAGEIRESRNNKKIERLIRIADIVGDGS